MKFTRLADCFKDLEEHSKRLEKCAILQKLLQETKEEEYHEVLLLIEGKIFPPWSEKKLGIAAKTVLRAISTAFGKESEKVEQKFAAIGDIGLCAEEFAGKKTQSTLAAFTKKADDLTVQKVFKNFELAAASEGQNSVEQKVQLLVELLSVASPLEARYIARIAVEDLRTGAAYGTIRDAIIETIFPKIIELRDDKTEYAKKDILFITDVNDITDQTLLDAKAISAETYEKAREITVAINDAFQHAYDRLNDLSRVALIAKTKGYKGLLHVPLEVGTPFRVMLMQRTKNTAEALEKIAPPCAIEYKYDGFRCIVHKQKNTIKLFTRNLENVTPQFPDIISYIKAHIRAESCILDGEILGLDKKGNIVAFQNISQRIKRKYDIEALAKELPALFVTWDILLLDGKTLIDLPLQDRRKILEKTVNEKKGTIQVSHQKIVTTVAEAEKEYKQSLAAGNEGVVVKDLSAVYQPGNRVGCWLKVKPIMDPLDLVIVAAEWGEGKRASWLTSYIVACRGKDDTLLEIGKVASGLKEIASEGTTYEEMTEALKKIAIGPIKQKVVKVQPKIILEVAYEEIQKSTSYSSGFALRFPRILQVRGELDVAEAADLDRVTEYFEGQ